MRRLPPGYRVRYKHHRLHRWVSGRSESFDNGVVCTYQHRVIDPCGGKTEATVFDENLAPVARAYARCRPDENYVKALGRQIALDRALAGLDGTAAGRFERSILELELDSVGKPDRRMKPHTETGPVFCAWAEQEYHLKDVSGVHFEDQYGGGWSEFTPGVRAYVDVTVYGSFGSVAHQTHEDDASRLIISVCRFASEHPELLS